MQKKLLTKANSGLFFFLNRLTLEGNMLNMLRDLCQKRAANIRFSAGTWGSLPEVQGRRLPTASALTPGGSGGPRQGSKTRKRNNTYQDWKETKRFLVTDTVVFKTEKPSTCMALLFEPIQVIGCWNQVKYTKPVAFIYLFSFHVKKINFGIIDLQLHE